MNWEGFLKAVKFFTGDKGILTEVYHKLHDEVEGGFLTDFKAIPFDGFHFESHIASEFIFTNKTHMIIPPETQEVIESGGKISNTLTIGFLNKTYRLSSAEYGIVIPSNPGAWKFTISDNHKELLDKNEGLQSEIYRTVHLSLKDEPTDILNTQLFDMHERNLDQQVGTEQQSSGGAKFSRGDEEM